MLLLPLRVVHSSAFFARRLLSGSGGAAAASASTPAAAAAASPPTASARARAASWKAETDAMLRVDHAGEVAAVAIYAGQAWALRGTGSAAAEAEVARMGAGEEVHVATLERLVAERRVRPTALLPLWRAAGWVLGASTALLGPAAAMACTVAVETAIGGHYNAQLRALLVRGAESAAAGGGGGAQGATTALNASDAELANVIRRHRDEELEHLETAQRHGAAQAPAAQALGAVIRAGCAAAIVVAQRI